MEAEFETIFRYRDSQHDFLRSLAKLRLRWDSLSLVEQRYLLYDLKSLVLLLHQFVNEKEEQYQDRLKEYQDL